ncbi:hypothetical protein VPH35_065968 [Triticum aestivum]
MGLSPPLSIPGRHRRRPSRPDALLAAALHPRTPPPTALPAPMHLSPPSPSRRPRPLAQLHLTGIPHLPANLAGGRHLPPPRALLVQSTPLVSTPRRADESYNSMCSSLVQVHATLIFFVFYCRLGPV